MHRSLFLVLLGCLGAGVVQAEGVSVQTLTGGSFAEFLDENELSLVFAFNPKCRQCQVALDFQMNLIKKMEKEGMDIGFGLVNEATFKGPVSALEIPAYPTFRIYRNPDCYTDYVGPMQLDPIFRWIVAVYRSKEAIHRVTTEAEMAELRRQQLAVHFRIPSSDTQALRKLKLIQRLFPDLTIFHGFESDPSYHSQEADPGLPYTLTLHRTFDDGQRSLSSPIMLTCKTIMQFVSTFSHRSFQRIDEQSAVSALKDGRPTLILFTKDFDSEIASVFRQAALSSEKELGYLLSDLSETNSRPLAAMFGLSETDLPAIAALDFGPKKYLKYRQTGIDSNDLTDFLAKFAAGRLREFQKSEEVPVQNHPNILTIVWNNFDLVTKSRDPVFLAFVSDSCQYCTELIDAVYAAERLMLPNKNLKFGFLNVDRNDVPPNIDLSKMPIAYLYKSVAKNEPVKYTGVRDGRVIADWIDRQLGEEHFESFVPPEVKKANADVIKETVDRAKRKAKAAESSPEDETETDI